MTEKLREPRLVLDLLMKDGERKIVSAMVLAEGQVADVRIPPHCTLLSGEQYLKHRLDVGRIGGERGGRTGGLVVEVDHVCWEFAAEFIDARHERLEVIAVLDPCILSNLFEPFYLKTNQVRPQYHIDIIGLQLCR